MPYADPEARKAYKARWAAANKDRVATNHARWRSQNRDKTRARSAKFNQSDEGKAYKAARHRATYTPKPRVLLDPEVKRARRRERSAKWWAENAEKGKAMKAAYRAENADREREYAAAYRAANVDKRREGYRRWEVENPGKRRAINQNRRSREINAEGRFTADDIALITKAQGGKCACCGKKRKLTIDHIKPLTKGGSNWPSNIQMLCQPCNSSKKDRDPVEHRQSLGMLI